MCYADNYAIIRLHQQAEKKERFLVNLWDVGLDHRERQQIACRVD